MMAGDQFASFTCSFVAEDGKESGSSGIIVQIDREDLEQLLEEPSCLKRKVGDKLPSGKPCYALITAYSNVYDSGPDAPDEPALERLAGRRIIVGNSDDQFAIPIEECAQCRAVSCCGTDSIMRLTEEKINYEKPNFTLKPHSSESCHIGFNFLILFLSVDAVNKRKPAGFPNPPKLSLAQCRQQFPAASSFRTIMYWRSKGKVETGDITMELVPESEPALSEFEPLSESEQLFESEPQLRDEVKSFIAKRSVPYQQKSQGSQVGAPIVICTRGGSYLIGINTGKKVTTLHGIFELLKAHVKFTPHYVKDLLHVLLEQKSGVSILKINAGGNPEDIIPALEILTAVFDNLEDIEEDH